MNHRLIWLLLVVGGCISSCGTAAGTFEVKQAKPDGAADLRFVVPDGAGRALDSGEQLQILPGELDAKLGDVIEIVNEDDRGHTVGPFFVGAGETVRKEFTSPGVFTGICTVHPSGEIVLTVS